MARKRWSIGGLVGLVLVVGGAQVAVAEKMGEGDRISQEREFERARARLLEILSEEELGAFLRGKSAREILLDTGERLSDYLTAHPELMGSFSIGWFSVDGGGGRSEGGPYRLTGTVGQWDTGRATGGGYVLTGGFWSASAVGEGGCVGPGGVFCDDFESGDTAAWPFTVGARAPRLLSGEEG